jgi:hypothetical protein
MPKNNSSINNSLFDLLKGKGYSPTMLSTAGKEIPTPDEAEVFQFNFVKDGEDYGKVTLTIDDSSNLIVYYSDDVADSEKEASGSGDLSWYGLLNQLKRFAQRYQLSFELRNTDNLKSDMAKRDYMKKQDQISESRNQRMAEGQTGVSVKKWAAQVRQEHGTDTKFSNDKVHDRVIARKDKEIVGSYDRKANNGTVFSPEQDMAEGKKKNTYLVDVPERTGNRYADGSVYKFVAVNDDEAISIASEKHGRNLRRLAGYDNTVKVPMSTKEKPLSPWAFGVGGVPGSFRVKEDMVEGLEPEKRQRLDDLIDQYRDATDPSNDGYGVDDHYDPDQVIELIRQEFGDKVANEVEAGTDKMHFPRQHHSSGYGDSMRWKDPIDRITKAGKMYKQDSDYRKNTLKSRLRRAGKVLEQDMAEGYSLKKTNVEKTFDPGDPEEYTQDVNTTDTDYEIINNKTGQVVGTASWTTNDFMGPGALKITMKNGATRWLDIWDSEKGNPQTAFNRFVKDPKTAKKYKEHDIKGVTEMDKSQTPSGRDGRVSHRTYGSRDTSGDAGAERTAKPITAKQATTDAMGILNKQLKKKDVKEMDNRTPSGDRREQRANSPEAIAQREKEQQKRLKQVSPEMRKKLRLPEPDKEDMSEGLGKDIKRLATGKDVKSRAGQEIAKAQDASMKGDTKTSKKHFDRFDKLDKLANKAPIKKSSRWDHNDISDVIDDIFNEQGVAEARNPEDFIKDIKNIPLRQRQRIGKSLIKHAEEAGLRPETIKVGYSETTGVYQVTGLAMKHGAKYDWRYKSDPATNKMVSLDAMQSDTEYAPDKFMPIVFDKLDEQGMVKGAEKVHLKTPKFGLADHLGPKTGVSLAVFGKTPEANRCSQCNRKYKHHYKQGVAEGINDGTAGAAKVRYTGGMHGNYEPTKNQASPEAHLAAAKYHDNEADSYTAAMNNPKADPKDMGWYKHEIGYHKNKADFHKQAAGQQDMAEEATKKLSKGAKVYHTLHGTGTVVDFSTGPAASHWVDVKFIKDGNKGKITRVDRKQLKLAKVESVAEEIEMKKIIGYKVIDTEGKEVIGKNGKVLIIPIRNYEIDGRYYELQGYEFEPVWSQPTQDMAEGAQQLSVQQLATISDEALDNAYHYGRSSPGNTFGWQANLKSAEFAKRMIDAGITDIEKISDAIHKGWNVTAKAFVENPEQFDDTEKLKAAGKLEAKLQQRAKLMNIGYSQLPDEEQEKDRVVARALLQALTGQQGMAEGSEQVYKVLAVTQSNAISKPKNLTLKARSIEEVFELLAVNDWYPLKINGVDVIDGKRLKKDMAESNQQVNEGYYPMGKQGSYSDAVPTTKIIIQHSRRIEEGEQRYRNIAKIFVENSEGERFAVPTNKPGLARVYARHIAEGGTPYDERGRHITSLVEEYSKMSGFMRATRGKQFNESAQQLVTEAVNYYQSLRESLSKMTGHRGYSAYFESWTPALMEDGEEQETNLNELFVQETLDPRIESVMPILGKLQRKLGTIKEVDALAEWADNIIEGDGGQEALNSQGIPEATDVTDDNPKSQGGTRAELLRKYANTKKPKDAEAARRAGASQSELKTAADSTEEIHEGASSHDLQNAILYRVEMRHPELFSKYGLEYVADKALDVASFYAGAEEIGSSDMSAMVNHLVKTLEHEGEHGLDENLDANQIHAGQLGPTEKVGPRGAVGKLVGANESVNEEEMAPDCTCRPHQTDSNCPVHGHAADPDGWNTMGESYEGKDELARILQMVKHKR